MTETKTAVEDEPQQGTDTETRFHHTGRFSSSRFDTKRFEAEEEHE